MDMIIYGSQIFGRLVRELLTATGHRFIGFVDDVHDGDDVIGAWEEVLRRFAPGDCGLAIAYCLLRLVLAFLGEEELGTHPLSEE